MIHKPIEIKNLCLSFSHKVCFENFNAQITHGNRIAIVGRNGCGKSSLLNILARKIEATSGIVKISEDVVFGYVPQMIENLNIQHPNGKTLSGGQLLNQSITKALANHPNILLLDEPTNHLDQYNRKSLLRMLRSYSGTLIIASHDTELLREHIDTLWHIENGKIYIFTGNYDDYLDDLIHRRQNLERKLIQLDKQKKETHQALMKEQQRAAKSKMKGKKSIHQRK